MDTLSIAASGFDWPQAFAARGLDQARLGIAYLFALVNVVVAAAAFVAARTYLLVSPNDAARDYGLYGSVALTTLLIATVLENELLPPQTATLQYAALPQLLALLGLHAVAYQRREPWLVTLAACSNVGAIAAVALAVAASDRISTAHCIAALLLASLLAFLWRKSISTKRAYTRAASIYLDSKEGPAGPSAPQEPWLGLGHWMALVGASFLLTVLNAVLNGTSLSEVPAVQVTVEALLLLGITTSVCAIPALAYWFARKSWMPELTRFVWLVWLVVGFTLTYGNFLTSLEQA